MINRNISSRRGFIKTGFVIAGAGVFGTSPLSGDDCKPETVNAPGPIPLNNILIDYQQISQRGGGLTSSEICDEAGWESKRSSIICRSGLMLGEPPVVHPGPVKADILNETARDGYKELKVRFLSGTGDMIKGFLLIPDDAGSSSPRPGIIALHSTGPGATQTVGITPREGRSYGMELAQRGYVVLAVDTITAGERVYPGYEPYFTDEFYSEYPHWSAMGKMLYDHKRGLDYLCSLDVVDAGRLGCIGHSLGGYNSFFLHAFEPRIKAAVASCGLSPMGGTNMPYQFARNEWFVHFNPACREYIRSGMIPCDMHEVMSLCAPKPFFNYSAKADSIYYPKSAHTEGDFSDWWNTVDKALTMVAKVYAIYGASGDFIRIDGEGDHDFPRDVRNRAYEWLDEKLGKL